MDELMFKENPRNYLLQLVEDGAIPADIALTMALKSMSYEDIRTMLEANDLSPNSII